MTQYTTLQGVTVKEMEFPTFWYESNAVWGWVEDARQLHEVYSQQKQAGVFGTIDEFLDKSLQRADGGLNFGTRGEHTGKPLRDHVIPPNVVGV